MNGWSLVAGKGSMKYKCETRVQLWLFWKCSSNKRPGCRIYFKECAHNMSYEVLSKPNLQHIFVANASYLKRTVRGPSQFKLCGYQGGPHVGVFFVSWSLSGPGHRLARAHRSESGRSNNTAASGRTSHYRSIAPSLPLRAGDARSRRRQPFLTFSVDEILCSS